MFRLAACLVAVVLASTAQAVATEPASLKDGQLVGWGQDGSGRISDAPLGLVEAISCGQNDNLALMTDGSLETWGYDSSEVVSDKPSGTDFQAISAGNSHMLALYNNGEIAAWGYGPYTQDKPTGAGFTAVAAGAFHGIAIDANGSIVSWGSDEGGRQSNVPTTGVYTQVGAGYSHSIALRDDGAIVGWGVDNGYGELTAPAGVFTQIAAGDRFNLALKDDGSIVHWGRTDNGLGDVPLGNDFVQVAAGRWNALALRSDGTLEVWGEEHDDATNVVRDRPRDGVYTGMSAGESHAFAIKAATWYADDLLVSGTGFTANLNRDVTVAGDTTIETTMPISGDATLTCDGLTTLTSVGTIVGSGNIAGRFVGEAGSAISPDGDLTIGDATSTSGFTTEGSLAVGPHRVTLHDADTADLGTSTILAGGTLHAVNGVRLEAGDSVTGTGTIDADIQIDGGSMTLAQLYYGQTLAGTGSVAGDFAGLASSRIEAVGGRLTIGDAGSFGGFRTDGELHVATGATMQLLSRGFAGLGGLTTLDGGTLSAIAGVSLGVGRNLSGRGTVDAKIAASFGSTIEATGDLTMGNATSPVGFASDGELYTGESTVVINDANEAVLGTLTTLGDGSSGGVLTAGNADPSDTYSHFLVEQGKNIVGRGTVEGHFKNHGDAVGDGTAVNERLVFNTGWTVTGKGTFTNTQILGTFDPGESPSIIMGTDQGFGGTIKIDLGGTTPGFGDDNHDQINDRGTVWLSDEVELQILPYGGFLPEVGDEFELITWQQGLQGRFNHVTADPWFAEQRISFLVRADNAMGAGRLILQAVSLFGSCDSNGDGPLNPADLDLLSAAIYAGQGDLTFDITDDGLVNDWDLIKCVTARDKLNTYFGDSDLDGEFNSSDMVQVFAAGKYETGEQAGWAEGDWDANLEFDSSDMVIAFVNAGYEKGPRPDPVAVPEPVGWVLLLWLAAGALLTVRRWR